MENIKTSFGTNIYFNNYIFGEMKSHTIQIEIYFCLPRVFYIG